MGGFGFLFANIFIPIHIFDYIYNFLKPNTGLKGLGKNYIKILKRILDPQQAQLEQCKT